MDLSSTVSLVPTGSMGEAVCFSLVLFTVYFGSFAVFFFFNMLLGRLVALALLPRKCSVCTRM